MKVFKKKFYTIIFNYNLYGIIFIGSYADSSGIEIIRKHVAQFIEDRDGISSDYLNVILCSGASDGIKVCTYIIYIILMISLYFLFKTTSVSSYQFLQLDSVICIQNLKKSNYNYLNTEKIT